MTGPFNFCHFGNIDVLRRHYFLDLVAKTHPAVNLQWQMRCLQTLPVSALHSEGEKCCTELDSTKIGEKNSKDTLIAN